MTKVPWAIDVEVLLYTYTIRIHQGDTARTVFQALGLSPSKVLLHYTELDPPDWTPQVPVFPTLKELTLTASEKLPLWERSFRVGVRISARSDLSARYAQLTARRDLAAERLKKGEGDPDALSLLVESLDQQGLCVAFELLIHDLEALQVGDCAPAPWGSER